MGAAFFCLKLLPQSRRPHHPPSLRPTCLYLSPHCPTPGPSDATSLLQAPGLYLGWIFISPPSVRDGVFYRMNIASLMYVLQRQMVHLVQNNGLHILPRAYVSCHQLSKQTRGEWHKGQVRIKGDIRVPLVLIRHPCRMPLLLKRLLRQRYGHSTCYAHWEYMVPAILLG